MGNRCVDNILNPCTNELFIIKHADVYTMKGIIMYKDLKQQSQKFEANSK